jgi:hypothetical protein
MKALTLRSKQRWAEGWAETCSPISSMN